MSAIVAVDEQDGGNTTTQTKAVVEEQDKYDDGNSFEDLFNDSTHQFLYATTMQEDGRDIVLGDKLLASAVIVVQIGLYIYLLLAAQNDVKSDSVVVKVSHQNCKASSFEEFSCDAIHDVYGPFLSAVFLFLAFICSDIAGALKLMFTGSEPSVMAKVTGLALLVEVFVATICCAMLANLGGLESGANAIMAAVGVAFIHDLDEKVRLIYRYVPKFKYLVALGVSTMVIGGVSIAITLALAYGD